MTTAPPAALRFGVRVRGEYEGEKGRGVVLVRKKAPKRKPTVSDVERKDTALRKAAFLREFGLCGIVIVAAERRH
jgi:hypothetical protein